MKEMFLSKLKHYKVPIVIFLSCILLISSVILFLSYNLTSNKTKRIIKNISKELNKINLTLESGIKDLSIDPNKSYNLLVSGSEKLNILSSSVSNIENYDEKSSLIKYLLDDTINSTIRLYDSCIYTLSNPKTISSNEDLNDFNILLNKNIETYDSLKNNDLNISLSDNTILFFNNTYNYLNTILKTNRDSEFKNIQYQKFISSLKSFTSNIESLNEDLSIAINKVREDKRDIQVIINDLYDKEKAYNNLKEQISYISIPDGYESIYNSLNEYLSSYNIYIQAMKEAVIYEKSCTDYNKYSNQISKNYNNAKSKLNDTLAFYDTYKNLLNKN